MRIDRIKLLVAMAKKDMNQRELSKVSGVSSVTINSILGGKRCADKTGYKIAAVGGGTGHAYAFREADRVDAMIGKWQKETPGAATPRAAK